VLVTCDEPELVSDRQFDVVDVPVEPAPLVSRDNTFSVCTTKAVAGAIRVSPRTDRHHRWRRVVQGLALRKWFKVIKQPTSHAGSGTAVA
jgi:hypothetical protein